MKEKIKISRKQRNMKKIEYRVESIEVESFNEEKNIKELKDFLTQLGSRGWELMGMIPTAEYKERIGVRDSEGFQTDAFVAKKCILIFKKRVEE
ncbi:MAG: hypothetical protein Q8M94_11005 [Ignavibacteria bacterium]|nr:hypothetical protein [Ignavibacteria bacterium]